MPGVSSLISIILDGDPPPNLTLPTLSGCLNSCRLIAEAIGPYLEPAGANYCIQTEEDFAEVSPASGLIVIYVVGHGWLGEQGEFTVSLRSRNGPKLLTAAEFVAHLNRCIAPKSQVILLVDTCAAAALSTALQSLACDSLAVLFASDRDERAWDFVADKVTRFAFEVSRALETFNRRGAEFDVVVLDNYVRSAIEQASAGLHQTVTYETRGKKLRLSRLSSVELRRRRLKTFSRFNRRLIAGGGIVVAVLFVAGIFWHRHSLVTIELGDVSQIIAAAQVEVYQLDPQTNRKTILARIPINDEKAIWRFLPADNLLIVFSAEYRDGKPRAINFHRVFQPGLISSKTARFVLPPSSEIIQRPGMAYVSANSWRQGSSQTLLALDSPFWIDIAPPTIQEYLPIAITAYQFGELRAHESMLVWHLLNKAGLSDADIRDSKSTNELVGRIQIADTLFADLSCPAPMTEQEAQLYLATVKKTLPTKLQWELAVRGVDGRVYPWGNLEDEFRINAGMPRDVGWEPRQKLRKTTQFPDASSPFGLIDTVGNAGDWVGDPSAPKEFSNLVFMGGVFQFNADECKSYSLIGLPILERDMLSARGFWMVTCRGVVAAQQIR